MTMISADGYLRETVFEGDAPYLMSPTTDKDRVIITKTDISTIKATIVNITSGATVLNQATLDKNDVWSDTYRTGISKDESTISYNFGWQTLSSYFSTTTFGDDAQFKVEVWMTPVSGQQVKVGGWLITAKHSIVPIPA